MRLVTGLSFFLLAFASGAPVGHAADINAEFIKTRPLVEGRRTPAILRLTHADSGIPVMAGELEAPLHLLAIDPALSDYHYVEPVAMQIPGNYIFTVTPQTPCNYKIWADLDTIHAGPQFVAASLSGKEDCAGNIDRDIKTEHEGYNYDFSVGFDTGTLKEGRETLVKLTVRRKGGAYFSELEPIMGAYAHLVGVYDDYQTIARTKPAGETPTSYHDRGGPILEFHIKPERAGLLKLFARLRINGVDVIAPFTVAVESATPQQATLPGMGRGMGDLSNILGGNQNGISKDDLEFERMLEERARSNAANDDDLSELFEGEPVDEEVKIYEDPEAELLNKRSNFTFQ